MDGPAMVFRSSYIVVTKGGTGASRRTGSIAGSVEMLTANHYEEARIWLVFVCSTNLNPRDFFFFYPAQEIFFFFTCPQPLPPA